MGMQYVKAYYDWLDVMEALSDGERGRLLTAVLQYARDGRTPSLSGAERFVFPAIRAQIDRDTQNYDDIAARRREAGRKGGLAKASKPKQELAKASKSKQEKEKEKEDTLLLERRFDAFWEAYPRKVGKAQAKKAFLKLRADDALLATLLLAIEREKGSRQWQQDGGRYIPYPATWLGGRRWEDEPTHLSREKGGYGDFD